MVLAVLATVATPAHAGDCFSDPVYDKDFSAVAKIGARVRDVACMEGSVVLTTVNAGTSVSVIGETDGWYKVKLSDGTVGWIGATLLRKVDDTTGEVSKTPEVAQNDTALAKRLAGYIVLQVEQKGEAYYINTDGTRIYMKDGDAAYSIMRDLGLGISEANFAKLKKGDKSLKERLKGKIVLQVEKHGEAHYINPKDGSITYLKDGKEAYKLMREKALGIKDKDLKKLKKKELWEIKKANKQINKEAKKQEKESEDGSQKSEDDSNDDNSNGTITLSANKTDNGVNLSWSLAGMESDMGFKVVWNTQANPVYPGNDYHYLSDDDSRSDTVSDLESGKAYHFRVCEYLGGKCGVYSNDVEVSL
ncbi:SH3 domain-containing protein [Candidatus Falkowbacteria bacterium]|nr:SH3 domain-containing protein [Candidatus Falkowbacteria bacterium]